MFLLHKFSVTNMGMYHGPQFPDESHRAQHLPRRGEGSLLSLPAAQPWSCHHPQHGVQRAQIPAKLSPAAQQPRPLGNAWAVEEGVQHPRVPGLRGVQHPCERCESQSSGEGLSPERGQGEMPKFRCRQVPTVSRQPWTLGQPAAVGGTSGWPQPLPP